MHMSGISVVINTFNEEKNLPKALASVRSLADEVVVVDMKSSDDTVAIAKKAGARVYAHKRMGYVEPARNFAITKAKGEWIFILDADETIPASLIKKLKSIAGSANRRTRVNYYSIPRKNIIFGKWIKHSRWWPDNNIRFFKKGSVSWSEIIHSVPETTGEGADLAAKESFAIIHYHYDSIGQYVERMNRYTSEHAKIKTAEGYEFAWQDLIRRPVGEFLSRYFFGKGYRDGLHGLALAGLQGLSELVLHLKTWEFQKKFKPQSLDLGDVVGQIGTVQREVNYWKADAMSGKDNGFIHRLKRKFRIR